MDCVPDTVYTAMFRSMSRLADANALFDVCQRVCVTWVKIWVRAPGTGVFSVAEYGGREDPPGVNAGASFVASVADPRPIH